jgi:hypothetical protein
VQDVALERHHQLHGVAPHYSENAVEEMRSTAETQSELAAAASSSGTSSSLVLPNNLNHSVKRASSAFERLSGSGSDNSFTLSPPSSGSSKMDSQGRHRPDSLLFSGSNEVSPTSASFSSSRPSPTMDYTHEGWTEEPIDYQPLHLQPVRMSSLPKERPLGRPPTSGAAFASPSPASKTRIREGRRQPTDYTIETSPESVKSKVFYSTNTLKTPPSRRMSIVSGLKKLGGGLRSGTTPRATNRPSPVAANTGSPTRPAPSTTTATDEVQIVSANIESSRQLVPSPPAMSSHFSISDKRKSPQPYNERAISDSEQYGSWSQTSDRKEALGGRIFDSSGLNRRSSQRSNIQHTSYDEARRPNTTSSMMDWSMQKNAAPHESHDEEREELQGECSPMSRSPHQSQMHSPSRPAPFPETSSAPPTPSPFTTRTSLEHNFNAAHDKRWSASVSPFSSGRRGSDASKRRDSGTSAMNAASDLHHRRSSWHRIAAFEGMGLGQSSTSQSLSSSRRTSLGRQSSLKASQPQLFRRSSMSRKQSANSLHISRPTSLVSTTSDIASISSHAHDHRLAVVSNVAIQDDDDHSIENMTPDRPSRSGSGMIEAKRPTFGLDLQPDAAAAFDSIPCPQPLRRRTPPTRAGLAVSTGEDNSLLSVDSVSIRDGEFPHTPDREDEDSRDEQESKYDLGSITFDSFNDLNSPRQMPPDTPESPVFEELELLEDLHCPDTRSQDSTAKAMSIDSHQINELKTKSRATSLSHSRSQEYSLGKPMTPQIVSRYDSFISRPRSTSYTYL